MVLKSENDRSLMVLWKAFERDAFAAAAGGPRLRGRPEADPEGMAACGQSLEGFAQMQCWARS